MIRWAEIGDLHLNEHDSLGVYDKSTGMNTRLKNKIDQLNGIIEKVIKEDLDFIVFMGDVYSSVNPSDVLRTLFNGVVNKILKAGIRVVIIPGNHETTGQLSAFESDKQLAAGFDSELFITSDEAHMMKIKGKTFCLVPFGKTDHLKKLDNNNKKDYVLFGHFTIEGCDFGNRKAKNLGSAVSIKEVQKYKYVSCGHIHLKQNYYCGSLFRNTFGEKKYLPTYRITTWEDDKISYEEFQSDNIEMKQIDVDENYENDDIGTLKGIIKVRYSGSREWLKTLNLVKERKNILSSFDHDIFSLKLEKKIVDISDNLEIKNEGKKLEFGEVLRKLSSDEKLIKYVETTVERL